MLDFHRIFMALSRDLDLESKDESYLLKRLSNEGLKFATVVLPSYAKHILKCIEMCRWETFTLSGGCPFRVSRCGLPEFLQGYLKRIFSVNILNSSEWILNRNADPVAILVVRQLCEYIYKLVLPFDTANISSSIDKFVECDRTVRGVDSDNNDFIIKMRRNFCTFYKRTSAISLEDCVMNAKNGPGTFSDKKEWEKATGKKFYHRNFLPLEAPASIRNLVGLLRFNRRSPIPKIETKVVAHNELLFVPKDSRGPRTIVREPYSSLAIQMGFNTLSAHALERDTRNRVNFADQSINQQLACESSISMKYATLDLKDASDRVSYSIVNRIFNNTPLWRTLDTLRTRNCKLPNGKMLELRKLSGMGSGFTFPCMSLIIHLAICTRVQTRTSLPYEKIMHDVYVYGDDIIVRREWFNYAVQGLELVGLTVNTEKSFKNSPFRESCGGDYFHGNAVSPIRLRMPNANLSGTPASSTVIPKDDLMSQDFFLLELERHCRELVTAQWFNTANLYYSVIEKAISKRFFKGKKYSLPPIDVESSALGRLVPDALKSYQVDRYGNCGKSLAIIPVALKEDLSDMCHIRRLTSNLKVEISSENLWKHRLFPVGQSDDLGIITVPRTVKLSIRKVRDYSLARF